MVTHLLAVVIAAGLAIGNSDSPSQEEQLERAARAYRIQVYDTFHFDRAEYDRRRAEWTRLEAAWQTAGKPDRDVPALLNWLAAATAQSQPESIGSLPAMPMIAADPQSHPKNADAWQVILPRSSDGAPAVSGTEPKQEPPKATVSAEKPPAAEVKPDSSAPVEQLNANKAATPVATTATIEQAALAEKPADKEIAAPAPPASAPNPPADGADPGRPSANSGWLHSLGEELGQDINSLGVTLAWKRESK